MIRYCSLFLIELYQFTLAPYLGGNCRYYPSCSNYAKDAFQNLPPHKALILSIKRIGRCHPGASFGYDPVPGLKEKCSHDTP